jgi:hypothetical protein
MKNMMNAAVNVLIERANSMVVKTIENNESYLTTIQNITDKMRALKEHAEKVFPEDKEMIANIDKEIYQLELKITYMPMAKEEKIVRQ